MANGSLMFYTTWDCTSNLYQDYNSAGRNKGQAAAGY
jgi:hypothetical protein